MAIIGEVDVKKPVRKRPRKMKEISGIKHDVRTSLEGQKVLVKAKGYKFKKARHDNLYQSDEIRLSFMKSAKEVQASLAPEFPSMIKPMLPSFVSGCFWLGIIWRFCIKHVPKEDPWVYLEDESGKIYKSKYLVRKDGLSGGWRGFSLADWLVLGDVLVFHLVMPTKFKVSRCWGGN